jgi:lactonase
MIRRISFVNAQFEYRYGDRFAPIPYSEQNLQTVTADYFYQIHTEKPKHVEGLCFDRDGNLFFTSHYENRALKLDMETKKANEIFHMPGYLPTAVKIHKDGRLFICCVGKTEKGGIFVLEPNGTVLEKLAHGYDVDDLVFDSKGGFYFTDLNGSAYHPSGGVFYVTPDYKSILPFATCLASPNGVALSVNDSVLWVTEMSTGRLHRIMLNGGLSSVVYNFIGSVGPDSCEIDADDNLYVALYGQGRFMVFNQLGFPIGQVLLPNREIGDNLFATHSAIRPGTKELYLCAADDYGDEGSWIFVTGAFGEADKSAYQFQ